MLTATRNTDNDISLYLWPDGTLFSVMADRISYTLSGEEERHILDMHASNATVHADVTDPGDWVIGKYRYDGNSWFLL